MLTLEENELLTRTGPDTPMGELMRRYWQPIAAVGQLDEHPTRPVRVMGEDLVLYRDAHGRYGLLDRHCAHRRADLCYGMVEDRGLRCHYHGWLFDGTGRCLEQPFEEVARPEARFKDKIALTAYPVEAKAGLLWAYLGPPPAPLVPDWDLYHERGYKQIVFAEIPCNWFQGQENSIDPIHFEWLHGNWSAALRGQDRQRVPTHRKVGFTEFDWGFVYRRVRQDTTEEDELWTVGRVCLWPNCLYTGKFEWRVPIDDEHTLHVAWFNDPLPGSEPFEQPRRDLGKRGGEGNHVVRDAGERLDDRRYPRPGIHEGGPLGHAASTLDLDQAYFRDAVVNGVGSRRFDVEYDEGLVQHGLEGVIRGS